MPYEPIALTGDVDAEVAMDARLIVWGRIEVRRGGGARQQWESDSTRQYFAFSPKDYSDAEHLSTLVLQLPKPQQRITLQAYYYDDNIATQWRQWSPYMIESVILPGLARQINASLRVVNHGKPEWERFPMVRPGEIDGIRRRAIKMLCNREAIAAAAMLKLHDATYRA